MASGAEVRSVPRTARERARAEITREILEAGRRHLATDGAAALSLRGIARDLGMVSSAVYRYVANRDDLLTRLIIDAYDALGAAAESREEAVDRGDLAGRWSAVCLAVRDWALANPNEWALIYGSPVPGYVAPADTIGPASRVSNLLVQILADAAAAGIELPDPASRKLCPAARAALAPVIAALPPAVTEVAIQAGLMVWAGLLGTVSLELFGQFQNVIGENPGDRDAFFAECVGRWAAEIGLG
ncbi:MAG TPA: TetR/AcrR family transcriptional regulator [Streptosporangiaceae bacterium]